MNLFRKAMDSVAVLGLALAMMTSGAQGSETQPCDGTTTTGTLTEVFCSLASTRAAAEQQAVDWHPQLPLCAECEDPAGPCVGWGLGFPGGDPVVLCIRTFAGVWLCCSQPGENGTKYVTTCSCEEI